MNANDYNGHVPDPAANPNPSEPSNPPGPPNPPELDDAVDDTIPAPYPPLRAVSEISDKARDLAKRWRLDPQAVQRAIDEGAIR